MLTKILYPIDLSPGSQKGLSWIANRVLQKNSQLITVHIVDTAAGIDTPKYVNDARISLQTLCETCDKLRLQEDNAATRDHMARLP